MRLFLILFSLGLSCFSFSQEIHFKNSDQKILLTKGAMVKIDADTAFVISKSRATVLNEKLEELTEVRKANEELQTINETLLEKVKEVEKLVAKVLEQAEGNTTDISLNLADIANELDVHLTTLKESNGQLAENNKQLEQRIEAMNQTIGKLKKDIRGIWWNGVADKLVAGIAGLGIGIVLASL